MRAAVARVAVGAALACACLAGAGSAEAHLLPAQQGTVNVVGEGIFTVLSVPASSLHGADDDGDGILDAGELERHEPSLREEIDRRLSILDGSTRAETVRIDLVLSPQHDAAGDRADQIVVLKHAKLGAPPRDLRVRCDLFGARATERALTLTATRHPGTGAETQVGVLTPGNAELALFPPAEAGPSPARAWLGSSLLCAIAALSLARRSRGRKAVEQAG